MCGKRLFDKRIESTGLRIPLDRGIELLRVEGLEPRAKPRQLARGKLPTAFSMSSAVIMPDI